MKDCVGLGLCSGRQIIWIAHCITVLCGPLLHARTHARTHTHTHTHARARAHTSCSPVQWGDAQHGVGIRVVRHMLPIDSDAKDAALLAVEVDLPHLPCASQREDRQLRVGLHQQTRNTDDRDRLAITHKEEP